MAESFTPGEWYLFSLKKIRRMDDRAKPFLEVMFECARGPLAGKLLSDSFYLTEKAISRFEHLAHRMGVEAPIKSAADVTEQICVPMFSRKVWARVIADELFGGGALKTDGWNFRSEDDPPEEQGFIDYRAQDDWAQAMEGL